MDVSYKETRPNQKRRNKTSIKLKAKQEGTMGFLGNQLPNLRVVKENPNHKSQGVKLNGPQPSARSIGLTHHVLGEEELDLGSNMASSKESLARKSNVIMEEKEVQDTYPIKSEATKELGKRSSKSLKRHNSSSGSKITHVQPSSHSGHASHRNNGNKFPRFKSKFSTRLGNEIQGQSGSSTRQSNSPDKSCSHKYHGLGRGRSEEGVDVHVPPDPNQPPNRVFKFGSSCLGSSVQPMMEIPNRCSTDFIGRGKEVEQATKAISDSTLRQIGMAHSGKEVGGL